MGDTMTDKEFTDLLDMLSKKIMSDKKLLRRLQVELNELFEVPLEPEDMVEEEPYELT